MTMQMEMFRLEKVAIDIGSVRVSIFKISINQCIDQCLIKKKCLAHLIGGYPRLQRCPAMLVFDRR